jgi:SAM-dependent methyltransferase
VPREGPRVCAELRACVTAAAGPGHGPGVPFQDMPWTSDAAFDSLLPAWIRHLSSLHWTPVTVARRAAAWLVEGGARRVLDVGAGPGKMCVVGALATAATWTGVERERALVDAAAETARTLGVGHRARFVHGDALGLDWATFDAFYFYNPFELVHEARDRLIAGVEERLSSAAPGVRVMTFHGFGGQMPANYRLATHDTIEDGALTGWICE